MSFDRRCWSLFKTMLQLSRKSSKKFLDGTFLSGYVAFFWSSLFKDQIWGHSVDPSFNQMKENKGKCGFLFFSGILVISCRCIYLLTLGKEQQKNTAFRLFTCGVFVGQKNWISHGISASTKGQKWSQLMRQRELELDLLRFVGLKSPVISSGPCHSTKLGWKFTTVKPIYFRPFLGVITPLRTIVGAHLGGVWSAGTPLHPWTFWT